MLLIENGWCNDLQNQLEHTYFLQLSAVNLHQQGNLQTMHLQVWNFSVVGDREHYTFVPLVALYCRTKILKLDSCWYWDLDRLVQPCSQLSYVSNHPYFLQPNIFLISDEMQIITISLNWKLAVKTKLPQLPMLFTSTKCTCDANEIQNCIKKLAWIWGSKYTSFP